MEGHRSGIIRRQVGIRPQGDRGDDIGIYPVLHIGGLDLALGRGFIKPDDADASVLMMSELFCVPVVLPVQAEIPRSLNSRNMDSGRFLWVSEVMVRRRLPPDI